MCVCLGPPWLKVKPVNQLDLIISELMPPSDSASWKNLRRSLTSKE